MKTKSRTEHRQQRHAESTALDPLRSNGNSEDIGSVTASPPLVAAPLSLAIPADTKPVRIGYFKPDAKEVFVVGSFNHWNPRATPLERDALGDWCVRLSLPPGEYRYRLMVDGEWRDDPAAGQTVPNPFGGFDGLLVV